MSEQRDTWVDSQPLKGFQDFLPQDMIARQAMADKIRRVYEKYGFVPVDTPILEHLEVLLGTGGEETNKEIFRLESPEKEPVAMRFDLTVPFARLISEYPEETRLPFRRYHIGPVFRADKPGLGRYRQFTQFDIDAAGSESVYVDAEIIAVMCEVMREVGFSNDPEAPEYQVRINNRKLVDALLQECGIESFDTQKHVLRVVDKLQKVGLENVRKELGPGRVDDSGDPIRGVGLDSAVIDRILAFIAFTGDSRTAVVNQWEESLSPSDGRETAIREMRDLAEALDSLGVNEAEAVFDPSMARGLDYYTGPVFETYLMNALEFGSVMSGGRYDQLAQRFMETRIPATGASIGFDRFMAALKQMGKIESPSTLTQVLILTMKWSPMPEILKMAAELRLNDIPTEVYFGKANAGVKAQLAYANHRGIPIAILLGEDELKEDKVSIKDLKAGMEQREGIQDREAYVKAGKTGQQTIPRSLLIPTVKELLAG
jgi:histidyl-tRNA synthetase